MKAEIKFESGIATTQQAISGSKVEILLGDVYKGEDGKDGINGKSAYQQAVEGGYKGSEQDFNKILARINDTTISVDNINKGGPCREIYESAGAVYNEKTGCYEMNGIVDLTYNDMAKIVVFTSPFIDRSDMRNAYRRNNVKTNIHDTYSTHFLSTERDITSIAADNKSIIAIKFGAGSSSYPAKINFGEFAFQGCSNLIELSDYITPSNSFSNTIFKRCVNLKNIKFKGVGNNLVFQDSPNLSFDSIKFIIENASGTAFTLTLHSDVYNKIESGQTDNWGTFSLSNFCKKGNSEYPYLTNIIEDTFDDITTKNSSYSGTKIPINTNTYSKIQNAQSDDWGSLKTLAQSKNITIASAAS